MAVWGPDIPRGCSAEKLNATTNTTATWTVKGEFRAELFGVVSVGAARITITSASTGGLAVKYLDLDFAEDVTDLVVASVRLRPDDEINLILDSGATGCVGIRVFRPEEA